MYGKNFEGRFCRCERGKTYDAETEEEVCAGMSCAMGACAHVDSLQTMFQCLCCEDWLHESCSSLRPSKHIDDVDSANRSLAEETLVDHDQFELFLCNECVCKPGNEVLKSYVGHKGWIVCLPTCEDQYLPDAVDDIPALTVMAKGKDWSHPWRVYGLAQEVVADGKDTQAEPQEALQPVASSKRQADGQDEGGAVKRARATNGLQVCDTFSDSSQADDDDGRPDLVVVQEGAEPCVGGQAPLFAAPDAKPVRLDVFLTETFRERLCRCKSVSAGG